MLSGYIFCYVMYVSMYLLYIVSTNTYTILLHFVLHFSNIKQKHKRTNAWNWRSRRIVQIDSTYRISLVLWQGVCWNCSRTSKCHKANTTSKNMKYIIVSCSLIFRWNLRLQLLVPSGVLLFITRRDVRMAIKCHGRNERSRSNFHLMERGKWKEPSKSFSFIGIGKQWMFFCTINMHMRYWKCAYILVCSQIPFNFCEKSFDNGCK